MTREVIPNKNESLSQPSRFRKEPFPLMLICSNTLMSSTITGRGDCKCKSIAFTRNAFVSRFRRHPLNPRYNKTRLRIQIWDSDGVAAAGS